MGLTKVNKRQVAYLMIRGLTRSKIKQLIHQFNNQNGVLSLVIYFKLAKRRRIRNLTKKKVENPHSSNLPLQLHEHEPLESFDTLERDTSGKLYDLLGLQAVKGEAVEPETVRKAFLRRARMLHPDKGGCNSKMAAVMTAMAVIGDKNRRRVYDNDCGLRSLSYRTAPSQYKEL